MTFDRQEHNDYLLSLIPDAELERVMSSDTVVEIVPECLTSLDYVPLAYMIPKHWTVIDFGCGYNAQSYLFREHKRLISVDLGCDDSIFVDENGTQSFFHFERFKPEWCEFVECTINEWIDKHLGEIDIDETFAICGWVPNFKSVERVRQAFKNVFAIYPHGGWPKGVPV
jgi:hypothetical protein